MADTFTPEKRSEVMAAIRSKKNGQTELRLASILKEHGLFGWRRHARVYGNPDFVFYSVRLAIFVDGCFWHGCPLHGRMPRSNEHYWLPKLERIRQGIGGSAEY
jgi:DNA mismatch endonuclease, patch repair protein